MHLLPVSHYEQNKHYDHFIKYCYVENITITYSNGPNFAYSVFSVHTLQQTKSVQASTQHRHPGSHSDKLMHDLIIKTEGHVALYNSLLAKYYDIF